MIKWRPRWQDRVLLHLGKVSKKTGIDISITCRLFFVALCEYALKNDCMSNGKLTVQLTVNDMSKICNTPRSTVCFALKVLTESGAITRPPTGSTRISPITIINYIDGEEYDCE